MLEKSNANLKKTEIGLLVKQNDVNIPLFDTTEIHATKAVDMALV